MGHGEAAGPRPGKGAVSAPLVPGTALVDYSRVPSMTAGYVVSRAGAAKLLVHRQPFWQAH